MHIQENIHIYQFKLNRAHNVERGNNSSVEMVMLRNSIELCF